MNSTPTTRRDHAARIARLNDLARKAMGEMCTVFAKAGIRQSR